MPTTAAYAICAAVITTGLQNLGALPIAAHLFVFYFACISAITPPVALAAYAAGQLSSWESSPVVQSLVFWQIPGVSTRRATPDAVYGAAHVKD